MKKEYLIGLLTGCLLTASAFMFMGAKENEKEVGRYQLAISDGATARMIDTKTGDYYWYTNITRSWRKQGGMTSGWKNEKAD